jgi:hypothetical protein
MPAIKGAEGRRNGDLGEYRQTLALSHEAKWDLKARTGV